MFTLALRMLGDEHQANDILQTTMLKMMQTIGSLSDYSKFNGWMKRITYNNVIDIMRSHSRLTALEDTAGGGYSAEDSLSIIRSESWDVEQFLAILEPRERLVVWLYTVEGYSHKEIGQQISSSEQNSRVIFSRAMKSLKTLSKDSRYSGKCEVKQ